MTADHDGLDAARRACSDRRWAAARALYLELHAARPLEADDLAALADCCWWLGDIDEYVATAARVVELRLAGGDLPGAGMAALEIGVPEVVRGRLTAGAGWLARARRVLHEVPDAVEHGYLLVLDAYAALEADDAPTADDLAARVLALADRHAEPTLQAHALFLRGRCALHRGRVPQARSFLDEAMVPVLGGRTAPQWAGDLYCRMMQVCHDLGDLPRAEHWTRVTEEWCRGLAPATLFSGICRVHRVQLMQVHGQWRRALDEAGRAAADLEGLDVTAAAEAHYRAGEVHRLRGDPESARQAYDRARARGRDPLPGLALLELEQGHRAGAAAMLDAALRSTADPLARAPLLAARVEVGLAEPVAEPSDVLVDELGEIADRHDSPCWRAEACRWRGALHAAHGRDALALPELREALDRWRQIDAPHEVARVRVEIADVLDALGDHDSARAERDLAASGLEALGADHAARRLAARGRRRAASDELSPREVEVLAAVADGATNRDAGRRLHISERTVARHLANIYLKLGTASRTGAVAWARDHALL
ncbi:LuxR C-terminal-related transcriptional regulator [Isoptericola haloaureus]|uniref:LuxR C-terminal-related transcriptional regulator n=1 Tax=Isoptericola haloaureus TaxID=1542902 RepID=A0ABU7ZA35_9MICO